MQVEYLRCDRFTLPALLEGRSLFFPMQEICDILGVNWRSAVLQLKPPQYAPIWLDARVLSPGSKGPMLCLRLDEFRQWVSQFSYVDSACRTSLRIPRPSGHLFHEHPATDSTLIRPPTPRTSGH